MREPDQISNHSFFSRVLDDIQLYRQSTRLHNEENVDPYAPGYKMMSNDGCDDNFMSENLG